MNKLLNAKHKTYGLDLGLGRIEGGFNVSSS